MARWRKSAAEGRRLTEELFTLQTATIVTAEPSAEELPTMQVMLTQLHQTYTDEADLRSTATFENTRDAVVRRYSDDGVPLGHPHERIARQGKALHDITIKAQQPSGGSLAIDERRLEPADAARIAKAWELAADTIDLTTSVSLETGDAITRFAYPPDTSLPPSLVAFHADMAELSLRTWGALVRLVSHFLASAIRLIRSFIASRTTSARIWRTARRRDAPDEEAGRRWSRRLLLRGVGGSAHASPLALPRAADGEGESSRSVVRRDADRLPAAAHAMFGRGGKLFITDGSDGTAGALRTLVQLHGDIVTRVTLGVLHDQPALAEHRAKIDAWFVRLNRTWMAWRVTLTTVLTGASAALLYRDVAVLGHDPAAHWVQLVLPLAPLGLRKAIAVMAHRVLLHAVKGPKALLPAKTPNPTPPSASRHDRRR